MSRLAIRGHATRGKEVIETLEMLGGENKHHINTLEENLLYKIRKGDNVIIATYPNSDSSSTFTLEEFLEKFPYKVGDKVIYKSEVQRISNMKWDCDLNKVIYTMNTACGIYDCYDVSWIKPYKEKTFIKCVEKPIDICLFGEQKTMKEQIKIDIPKGYEIASIDANQVLLKRIRPKYPKDFDECCYTLEACVEAYFDHEGDNPYSNDYEQELEHKLICLRKLLICRDAYWKLAENWKPNWSDNNIKYIITIAENKIYTDVSYIFNYVLSFPTEEMRDKFCENFKALIEQCKELL